MLKMNTKFLWILSFFLCISQLYAIELSGNNIYEADTPQIRYIGRINKNEDKSVSFDWSGTYLSTRFTGGHFVIKVSDTGTNYYNVFLDGKLHKIVKTTGKDALIQLVEGLDEKEHHIRLQKRTEGEQGLTTIHAFILADNGKLMADNTPVTRWIEYIGDSLTTGFGSEGKKKEEPFTPETENCDITYACMIARCFDADYTLIAHSGRGAVRNYGDSLRVSQYPMADRMMFAFDSDPTTKWDFKSYKPSLVVVNLGSNDFSTKPHPNKEEFTTAYKRIINQIREKYGKKATILCVGPRVGEPAFSYIKELCDNIKDKNLYFRGSVHGTYNNTNDMGAAWHPNIKGQQKIAMSLIPYISTIMNWEVADSYLIQ